MEMDIRSRRGSLNRADWLAGAIAGFAAGAVMMVLEMLWSSTDMGGNPWVIPHKIAAIGMGENVLHTLARFDVGIVALALVIHYVLGIFTGLVVAALVALLHLEDRFAAMLLAGLLLGVAIYLVNFYVMTAYFPWFTDLRGSATMVAHMIFGVAAAAFYWQLGRVGR